ncbi:glycosyltransferase [Fibrobacter sp.]|uniref:glycosyltransferase n=1 Tax=Fibrobacter sp. TaxID=35828 RepID=UPI00388E4935
MKILLINLTLGRGSTGKIVQGITKQALANGDEVFVVYGYYDRREPGSYCVQGGNINTVRRDLLRIRITGYNGFSNKRKTKKVLDLIDSIKPDVIHLHNIHGGYIQVEYLFEYIKKNNIPVVWTLHDCWAFTGRCAYFSIAKCSKWKKGCFDCHNSAEYPGFCLFDRSKEQWARKKEAFCNVAEMVLVTPSYWLAGLVKESFLKEYEVRTIYNGIDTDVFAFVESDIKQQLGLSGKKIILGVSNTWDARKGLDDLIELSEVLDDSFKIVVVGHIKDKRRKDKIINLPRMENQNKLAELYSAADVFVNPSREETLGMTTIEAMSCGTPVITYNLTAVSEPVSEGCGIVLDYDENKNIDNLKSAILKMTSARNEFNKSCRDRVVSMFGEKERFCEYVNLYHKMLDGETI